MTLSHGRKQQIVGTARRAGILPLLDAAFFWRNRAQSRLANAEFIKTHPDFSPPPLRWMHDMYRHTSFDLYWRTGKETAAALSEKIDALTTMPHPRVADWGCGLARIVRHLPQTYERSGFDYNRSAIKWCANNIENINFAKNAIAPPLPVAAKSFDIVYGLSVFTHLSEQSHYEWRDEIARVLAPGGYFLGAFHMQPKPDQLLPAEQSRFDSGELVVRGRVKEGSRTFTAHHPEAWLRRFLSEGFELVGDPEPFFGQTLLTARRL